MAILELHVWGPAFSLPSLDAQCLGAIAYVSQALPKASWRLVASSDPDLSPVRRLPALRSEDVWIGGFRNIVDYITKYSGGTRFLDADLTEMEMADCIAFSSFIEAYGQPLLDLSLYVSTQNYTAITRPLYNTIQPFPLPYITPSSIRSAAKSRTACLGLSSLDIDSHPPKPEDENQSFIPQSLRTIKTTVSSLLSENPEHAAQIRLDALAMSFFEPLQDLRGNKRFFVSHSPTSLDCIALGYLALALMPDLPSSWLANCMRRKFPELCDFVYDMQQSSYGGVVRLEDAYLGVALVSEKQVEREKRAAGNRRLPWSPPPHRGGILVLASALNSSIADSIPVVSRLRQTNHLKGELEVDVEDEERESLKQATAAQRRTILTSAASMAIGVGVFIRLALWYGVLGWRDTPLQIFASDDSRSSDGDMVEEIQENTVLEAIQDINMGLDMLTGHIRHSRGST